jgi:hypothetical protein
LETARALIEATLVGLNWDVCLSYLDDIIIWANGDTEEEAFEQSMERLELCDCCRKSLLVRCRSLGFLCSTSTSHPLRPSARKCLLSWKDNPPHHSHRRTPGCA